MRFAPVLCLLALTLSVGVGACKQRAEPSKPAHDASPAPSAPKPEVAAHSSASSQSSSEPLAAPTLSDAGEVDGAYLSGRTWITCMDGFRVRSTPALDLLRLGMLCGPYHGMRRLGEPLIGKLAAGASQRQAYEAKRDQCFRAFGVTAESIKRWTLRATGPSSNKLAESTIAQRFGALDAEGVFCVHEAGNVQLEIQAVEGAGEYAVQLWLLP